MYCSMNYPIYSLDQEIHSSNESLYNILAGRDSSKTSNYLLINDFLDLDKQEAHQLLQYVHDGNDTFIAASNFGDYLCGHPKYRGGNPVFHQGRHRSNSILPIIPFPKETTTSQGEFIIHISPL